MWYILFGDDVGEMGSPEMAQPLSVSVVCPTCGKLLVGPRGPKAQLIDMLSCSEHGEVGKFEDIIERMSEKRIETLKTR